MLICPYFSNGLKRGKHQLVMEMAGGKPGEGVRWEEVEETKKYRLGLFVHLPGPFAGTMYYNRRGACGFKLQKKHMLYRCAKQTTCAHIKRRQ